MSTSPNDSAIQALREKGKAAFDAKNFPSALQIYTQGTTEFPTEKTFWANRSQVHFLLGNYESCIADSEKALEIDPAFSKSYFRIGNSYVHLAEYAKAREYYGKAKEAGADDAAATDLLKKVDQYEKEQRDAKDLIRMKRQKEAAAILTSLIQNVGANLDVVYDTVTCLQQLERYDEALTILVQRQEKRPFVHDKMFRYLMATTYFSFALLDDTEKHISILSSMPEGAYFMDVAAIRRKCEDLQQVIRNSITLQQGGKYEWAYDALTKALAQDTLLPNQRRLLLTHRAIQLSCLTRYQEAMVDCNAALDGGAKGHWRVKAYQMRGYCHEALDDITKAIDDYERVLMLKPDLVQTRDRLDLLKKMRQKRPDYYRLLGVRRDATPGNIKEAYYKLAKEFHPDKCRSDDDETTKSKTETMQRINEAYSVLSDPEKRARYDAGEPCDEAGSGSTMIFDMFDMCCGVLPEDAGSCQKAVHEGKKCLFMSTMCVMFTVTCPCWCPYLAFTKRPPPPNREGPDTSPP
eukprot:PhM_4_TR4153/c0_g1_i1/m.73957/K09527/DNAJC7; DnaJ homolog subfamily C member 7